MSEKPGLEDHKHLPLTPWEKAMEFFSAASALLAVWSLVRSWALLPDSVPVRFNLVGDVVSWGGRGAVIVLVAATVVLYLGLSILGRVPRAWNVPWPTTAENAEAQYRIVRRMLITLKVEGGCSFLSGLRTLVYDPDCPG